MPKRQIQVGGRKEVRLAVVESSGLAQEQQRQVFTPEDAVYQRYSELISGYLEKVARWHAIFQEEQYIFHQQPFQPSEFNADIVTEELESRFEVVQTHEGLVIGITKGDLEDGRRPERVIHAEMKYDRTLPYKGTGGDPRPGGSRHLEMEFTHGLMGTDPFFDLLKEPVREHPFVDPEGNPLATVEIGVNSFFGDTQRQIKIVTSFPTKWNRPEEEQYKTHHVEYVFQDDTLEVSKYYPYLRNSVLMSDTYATDLFNTVDALIPGTTNPIPQPGRRATPELRAPRRLTAPRRTPGR